MIYTHIAYAPIECGKNLGCAYNKFMETLPSENDWACFLDHDAMFTTSDWYLQLNEIIKKNPSIEIFGARTNRIGRSFHLVGNIDVNNHDIKYHRQIGEYIQKKWYSNCFVLENGKTEQGGFSGVVILIKKSAWRKMGGFLDNGFLGVDDNVRASANLNNIKIAIMNGVYVYHWYRADNPYKTSRPILNKIQRKWFSKNQKIFDINKIFLFGGNFNQHLK